MNLHFGCAGDSWRLWCDGDFTGRCPRQSDGVGRQTSGSLYCDSGHCRPSHRRRLRHRHGDCFGEHLRRRQGVTYTKCHDA